MTLSFEQVRDLITATRARRRYSHSLPSYVCAVLALAILSPSAVVLGIATRHENLTPGETLKRLTASIETQDQ